jgi:hypothetical protein
MERCAEMPISDPTTSGEITRPGASKCVTMNGFAVRLPTRRVEPASPQIETRAVVSRHEIDRSPVRAPARLVRRLVLSGNQSPFRAGSAGGWYDR